MLRIHVHSRAGRWFWRLEEAGAGWVEYAHPTSYRSAQEAADAGRVELAKRVIRHGWAELTESAKQLTAWVLDRLGGMPDNVLRRRPQYRTDYALAGPAKGAAS